MSGLNPPTKGKNWYVCPRSPNGRHKFTPNLAYGANPDGSAMFWPCDFCEVRSRFVPYPPVTVKAP